MRWTNEGAADARGHDVIADGLARQSWRHVRLRFMFDEIDRRVGTPDSNVPLLSVSIHRGVVPRSEMTDREARADDFVNYKRVARGDIVINRMRAFEGGAGISSLEGIVSSDYAVLRTGSGLDPRFFHHLIRSRWFVGQMTARLRGIGGIDAGNVRTPRINVDDLGDIRVALPSLAEQRATADYLDAESARIDVLVAARRRQVHLIDERVETAIWQCATKGLRRTDGAPSGLDWVGDMPRRWGLPSVGANFDVQLGKMLNPEAAQAGEQFPYLRNVNVQWDRIDLADLNEMHFDVQDRLRYALEPSDLIVCEGGEVGRAALWEGAITGCYYQKALHRVRPRRDASARFLMYALWAAASRGVFENEGNTSTIVHLTAEKLRAHRFPWPPRAEQDEIVEALDRLRSESELMKTALESQVELLLERRQALITAAVTGQLEIPGAAA